MGAFFRFLLKAVILGFVALVFVVLLALWAVRDYLLGPDFRREIAESVKGVLGVEGKLNSIQWIDVQTAESSGYSGVGTGRTALRLVRAEKIGASFDGEALRERLVRLKLLRIDRLHLDLAKPAAVSSPPFNPAPPAPGDLNPILGALAPLLPDRFELGGVRAEDFSFNWDIDELNRGVAIKMAAELVPEGDGWKLTVKGGQIQQFGLPVFDMDGFTVIQTPGRIEVRDAKLRLAGGGEVAISGNVAKEIHVDLSATEVEAGNFLPLDWGGRLSGKMDAACTLTCADANASQGTFSGHVTVRGGRITKLRVLETVATGTGVPEYRDLGLDTCELDFTWDIKGRILQVTNLVIESKNLIRVEGQFALDPFSDAVRGDFQIGVTDRTLRRLPTAKLTVFTENRDGYRWAKTGVMGPLASPSSDLISRLLSSPAVSLATIFTDALTIQRGEVAGRAADAVGGTLQVLQGTVQGVAGALTGVVGGGTDQMRQGANTVVGGAGAIVDSLNPLRKPGTQANAPGTPGPGAPAPGAKPPAPALQGQPMPQGQPALQGQPMPQGQPALQGQPVPQGQPAPGGARSPGQPIPVTPTGSPPPPAPGSAR